MLVPFSLFKSLLLCLSFEIANYCLGTLVVPQIFENSIMTAFPKSYTEWAVKSYRSACCPALEFQGRQVFASASSSERDNLEAV